MQQHRLRSTLSPNSLNTSVLHLYTLILVIFNRGECRSFSEWDNCFFLLDTTICEWSTVQHSRHPFCPRRSQSNGKKCSSAEHKGQRVCQRWHAHRYLLTSVQQGCEVGAMAFWEGNPQETLHLGYSGGHRCTSETFLLCMLVFSQKWNPSSVRGSV